MFQSSILRLSGLLAFSCAAFGQQFTADLVHAQPQTDVVTKAFVSGGMVRFETTSQSRGGVVIMDLEKRTSMMLVPASKSYVVSPPGRPQGPMPLFRPKDADSGCEAWEKLVNKPGTCTKVGDETINGRNAVKYKGTNANGETGFAWVDKQLLFVTKWEGEKTGSEFKNIQEGPQAASLFEVPSDYDKIDVPQGHKNTKGKKPRTGMMPRP